MSRGPSATPADLERERRNAEYSLALLDSLCSEAPVGLALVDTDVRFRRVNNHLAAMSGVAAEAHIGERPEEVLGGLGAELAALYRGALAEPHLSSHELHGETLADSHSTRHRQVSLIRSRSGARSSGSARSCRTSPSASRLRRVRRSSRVPPSYSIPRSTTRRPFRRSRASPFRRSPTGARSA